MLAATGLADPGGKGKAKKQGHNRFSAQVVVPDNGTCGNQWATDTSTRKWSVKKNKDGTFRVERKDKGTFVTLAGQSPGACDTTGKHGHLVTAPSRRCCIYSSKRPVPSRSRSYRLVSGNGGNQDSRRTIQLS